MIDPLLIEVVMLIAVGAISWSLLRSHLAANLVSVSLLAANLLGNGLLGMLIFQLALAHWGNWVLAVAVGVLFSSAIFWLLGMLIRRRARKQKWGKRLKHWFRLPFWCERGLNSAFVLIVVFMILLAVDLTIQVVSISPVGHAWASNSVVLRYFIERETPQTSSRSIVLGARTVVEQPSSPQLVQEPLSDPHASIRQASALQADFMERFSNGIQRTRHQVYAATGLDQVQREIHLSCKIVNLSPDEKMWLLTNNPQLMELIEHPVMHRILHDDELLKKFERFAAGRLDDVMAIGAHPDIDLLMKDEAIQDLIRQIDLEEMLRQCEQRR